MAASDNKYPVRKRGLITAAVLLLCWLQSVPLHAQLSSGTVIVRSNPVLPDSVTADADTICMNGSAALQVNGGLPGDGGIWRWYAGACGAGPVLGTGPQLRVYPGSTTVYYCRSEGGCLVSPCLPVAVVVRAAEDCQPLPVTLLRFDAQLYLERKGLLTWQAAAAPEVAYFAVEKSTDARTFSELGKLFARGRQDDRYTYIDPLLAEGDNFYRLRIVDRNGAYVYSPVRTLRYRTYQPPHILRLYPNPASDIVHIECYSPGAGFLTTSLINMQSRQLYGKRTTQLAPGRNVIGIDIADLPDGQYLLRYQPDWSEEPGTLPLIKLSR